MAKASENLARSLQELQQLQEIGFAAIKSNRLSKTHRERLIKNGFLRKITNGWYLPTSPDEMPGDTTSWYSLYWQFCSQYLENKFGKSYCLSADHSIQLHSGNKSIPVQLIVRSPKANNRILKLINNTSVFFLKQTIPTKADIVFTEGLLLYSLPSALVNCSGTEFTKNPIDTKVALGLIRDSSDILKILLEGGHSVKAGVLAGAFRNIHRNNIADSIVKTMQSASYKVRETDPFNIATQTTLTFREKSPYTNRIHIMWQQMREDVIKHFPKAPGIMKNHKEYMLKVEEVYMTDAYHSLSIERYKVTAQLIQRVKSGNWNKNTEEDKTERNRMAARGYYQAFQQVKLSITKILKGKNPGEVADTEFGNWYRELFAPSVTAGIIKPSDLAGYRSSQVYIGNSNHVPLNPEAVREAMPVFFDLLKDEKEASVRGVLGHFIFVYIHPYMDGNGRMARFLMNTMLASGGYPWTVIPVEERNKYMEALEIASVQQNIIPFTKFIAYHVTQTIKGKPVAKI